MGYWGNGIFDSDQALDELAMAFQPLLMRFRDSLEWIDDGNDPWWQTDALVLAKMVLAIAAACPHNSYWQEDAKE